MVRQGTGFFEQCTKEEILTLNHCLKKLNECKWILVNVNAVRVEQLLQGVRSTDRADEVGSVICLWTLSLVRVWTWFFSDLAWTSREMSGDVWLIFRPDSTTGTAKGGHDASFTQSSSLSSLSSPSTWTVINCITRSIVEMWQNVWFILLRNCDKKSY